MTLNWPAVAFYSMYAALLATCLYLATYLLGG